MNLKEMIESPCQDKIIDEIVEMIRANIIIYCNNSDQYFLSLKKYCKENYDKKYKSISYSKLLFYVEEALAELINCPYLYDCRDLD